MNTQWEVRHEKAKRREQIKRLLRYHEELKETGEKKQNQKETPEQS